MDVFFEVYDWAKKRYALSRIVKIDLEECSLKVYEDDRLVVIAKGDTADLEHVYLDAALRLDSWTHLRGDTEDDKHLHSLWQKLQSNELESDNLL